MSGKQSAGTVKAIAAFKLVRPVVGRLSKREEWVLVQAVAFQNGVHRTTLARALGLYQGKLNGRRRPRIRS